MSDFWDELGIKFATVFFSVIFGFALIAPFIWLSCSTIVSLIIWWKVRRVVSTTPQLSDVVIHPSSHIVTSYSDELFAVGPTSQLLFMITIAAPLALLLFIQGAGLVYLIVIILSFVTARDLSLQRVTEMHRECVPDTFLVSAQGVRTLYEGEDNLARSEEPLLNVLERSLFLSLLRRLFFSEILLFLTLVWLLFLFSLFLWFSILSLPIVWTTGPGSDDRPYRDPELYTYWATWYTSIAGFLGGGILVLGLWCGVVAFLLYSRFGPLRLVWGVIESVRLELLGREEEEEEVDVKKDQKLNQMDGTKV